MSISAPETLTLEPKSSWNQFDEFGLLAGIKRLSGETNATYKHRIIHTFSYQANSTYRGLVNGITRELGLSLFRPLTINPKLAPDGSFLAADPYIKFDGAYLYLYSNYAENLLDWSIDRYEPGGNFEHITRLVDLVNTTEYFEASLNPGYDPYLKSMTILNQSNRILVDLETVQPSTKSRLKHKYIVPSTFLNNNYKDFKHEVYDENDLHKTGDCYIDYVNGVVSFYSAPGVGTAVQYQYVDYSFQPLASSVILYDINSENFKTKMFQQILDDTGIYRHGVPTEIGVDIINELISVTPMYWGT